MSGNPYGDNWYRDRAVEAPPAGDGTNDSAYELLARIAVLAWEATGGTPGVDATDAWNDLCRLLEGQPDSFPDVCRAVLASPEART